MNSKGYLTPGRENGGYLKRVHKKLHTALRTKPEAMILVKAGESSLRGKMFDLNLNQESLTVGHDMINEFGEETYKLKATRRYNSKVKPRNFQEGNLVWRMHSDARQTKGKFSANWE